METFKKKFASEGFYMEILGALPSTSLRTPSPLNSEKSFHEHFSNREAGWKIVLEMTDSPCFSAVWRGGGCTITTFSQIFTISGSILEIAIAKIAAFSSRKVQASQVWLQVWQKIAYNFGGGGAGEF